MESWWPTVLTGAIVIIGYRLIRWLVDGTVFGAVLSLLTILIAGNLLIGVWQSYFDMYAPAPPKHPIEVTTTVDVDGDPLDIIFGNPFAYPSPMTFDESFQRGEAVGP